MNFHLNILMAAFCAGLTCVVSVPASAQNALPGLVSIRWKIIEAAPDIEAKTIKKNRPLYLAKAMAEGLVTIDQPAVRSKGLSAIPMGTIFARSPIGTGVICEPGRRPGQETIACLADNNGDGRFESFGRVYTQFIGYYSSTSIGFLVGENRVGHWGELESPVGVAPVAEASAAGEINLQLTLTSLKSSGVGRGARFSLCAERNEGKNIWGAPINVQYCASELEVLDGSGWQPLALLPNGSVRLISLDKSSAAISLDSPKVGSIF